MKFYTSVEQAGNRLLVRGYENGNRYSVRVPFNPTLYLPTKNYSEWRTLGTPEEIDAVAERLNG